MSKKTAEDLVNDPRIQKYMVAIDTDADAALALAKRVLGSPMTKYYSSTTLAQYKGDVTRLDKCWGNFNMAWNKVAAGRAKSSKDIIQTYSKYVLALEILEQSNTRHQAMMTAGLALLVAALLEALVKWVKAMKDRFRKLEKELKEIRSLVEKAEWDEIGAYGQTTLNIVVTAVSFCLGPVGWGARIGVAVGGLATHAIIDALLGPSMGSALGTLNTAAGESTQLYGRMAKGSKQIVGASAAVMTLKMDTDEIGQAEKIIKQVRKRLRNAESEYISLFMSLKKWDAQIQKMNKQCNAALRTYEAAARKFKSSQRKREELLKDFKQWK